LANAVLLILITKPLDFCLERQTSLIFIQVFRLFQFFSTERAKLDVDKDVATTSAASSDIPIFASLVVFKSSATIGILISELFAAKISHYQTLVFHR